MTVVIKSNVTIQYNTIQYNTIQCNAISFIQSRKESNNDNTSSSELLNPT